MNKNLILKISALLTLLLACQWGQASHNMGIEARIECVNACSLRVNYQLYRDCSGVPLTPLSATWRANGTGCTSNPTLLGQPTVVVTDVTPICSYLQTHCTSPNGTVRGVEEHRWSALYNTCNASPCTFDLIYSDCCRNAAVTSLDIPVSLSMSILLEGIDLSASACNNSPIFNNRPVLLFCAGQPRTYDLGGTDPDGDSLSYAFTICRQNLTLDTVPYRPGYSPTAPLGPSWACTLDPVTGILHLNPQPGSPEIGVICITTSEYRNGNLIATNTRDMQVDIMNCAPNAFPIIGNISPAGGNVSVTPNGVYACVQTPFCIDILASDPDSGQVFSFYWEMNIPGATFAAANNPNAMDTLWSYFGNALTGRFCWTPPTPGTYELKLHANDNFCPIPSIADTTILIHVVPMPFVQASANLVDCLEYDFVGLGGGCGTSGNFTYQWTGGGGISSTAPSFNHHFPAPGYYPWQLIVDDGQGYRDTIQDTVHAIQTLTWAQFLSPATPIDACNGPTSTILDAGPGFVQYTWSTGASTQAITVNAGGSYVVTVEETTGCLLRDNEVVSATPADLSGIVTTHLGQPMGNQVVRLLRLQPSPLAIVTIDSTFTDASGYYQFCNITDTTVYAKVHPSVSAYPLDMPTYANSALVWNVANGASPLLNGPTVRDIQTIYGQNPGGTASLGGTVVQGSNKVDSLGDPVPGLRLFLRHVGLGQIVGYRDTDVNGYFIFSGLPLADYEVVPDFPYVDENLPPLVSLTNLLPHRDQLDFRLHPTWLELVTTVAATSPTDAQFDIQVSPNPFHRLLDVQFELGKPSQVEIQCFDLAGRALMSPITGSYGRGKHAVALDLDAFSAGMYCLRIKVGDSRRVMRIVKD